MEEESITVLHNNCFGGWTINPIVTDLYNERRNAIIPIKYMPDDYASEVTRHDPILVDIYHELGETFDNDRSISQTNAETIPAKYKDYYHIEEYEGRETVVINMDKYEFAVLKEQIRLLLENTATTDAEKIAAVRQLL